MNKGCIIVAKADGTAYLVPIGERLTLNPGDKIVGESTTCDGGAKPEVIGSGGLQKELSDELGTGFGDVLKQLAKPFAVAMGRTSCTSCEARRLITNAYAIFKARHGKLEAVKIIKDLWLLSFKATGDEVLAELKLKLKQ